VLLMRVCAAKTASDFEVVDETGGAELGGGQHDQLRVRVLAPGGSRFERLRTAM
jgi:hypothetical protein